MPVQIISTDCGIAISVHFTIVSWYVCLSLSLYHIYQKRGFKMYWMPGLLGTFPWSPCTCQWYIWLSCFKVLRTSLFCHQCSAMKIWAEFICAYRKLSDPALMPDKQSFQCQPKIASAITGGEHATTMRSGCHFRTLRWGALPARWAPYLENGKW